MDERTRRAQLHRYADSLRRHTARQLLYRAWNRVLWRYHVRPPRPVFVDTSPNHHGDLPPRTLPRLAIPAGRAFAPPGCHPPCWWTGERHLDVGDVEEAHDRQRFRGRLRKLAAAHLTGADPQALPALVELVAAWLRGEEPSMDRAMEPINIALRMREWIWALMLVGQDPAFPGTLAVEMRRSLLKQAARLSRHIEHEVPGNHPVVDLASVWLATAAFGCRIAGAGARGWARALEREASRSFLPDGFHVELSTHYHVQTLRVLEEYALLARALGDEPGASFLRGLERWRRTARVMAPPEGPFPMLGDQCRSFLEADLEEDLCCLRALHPDRSEPTAAAACLRSPSAFWLRAVAGQRGTSEQALPCSHLTAAARQPAPSSPWASTHWFANAGYLVHRWLGPGGPGFFVLDGGELGYWRNPGHGHADHLSVVLYVGGRPVLIDPGVLRYGEAPEYRWFKSARAHNTLCFADREPADFWRFFRWCDLPPRPELRFAEIAGGLEARARFRGYARALGADHCRSVRLLRAGRLSIRDEVAWQPQGPCPEISLHFHPQGRLERLGEVDFRFMGRELDVRVRFSAPTGGAMIEVAGEPVASGYGLWATGPVLRARPLTRTSPWVLLTDLTWPPGPPS